MRKKIIFTILAITIVALLLMASKGKQTYNPHIVHFKPGTTYEEAASAIGPLAHPQNTIMIHWWHPHGVFEAHGWRSSIIYKPNQNIAKIRSEHWKEYYGLVQYSIRTAQDMIANQQVQDTASPPPNQNLVKHLEWSQQERERLNAALFECWESDTCPAIPATHTRIVIFDNATLSVIQALPIVERVQIPNP